MNNEYLDYIKSLIGAMQEAGTMPSDITFGYHDDFYYDRLNQVEITISQLNGTITKGIVQTPYMIYISMRDDLPNVDDLRKIFDELFIDLNETVITLSESKAKQFYTTSAVLSRFNDSDATKYIELTIQATLINITGILELGILKIGGVDCLGPLVGYTVVYEAQFTSSGAIGTTAQTSSVGTTYNREYTLCFVANTSNNGVKALLDQQLKGTNPNYPVSLQIKWAYQESSTNITVLIKTATIEHDLTNGTLPILRVILALRS